MCIDHGSAHVFVAQQLLNSPDVIAVIEKMSCEAMPESMTASMLGNVREGDSSFDTSLQDLRREMVSADHAVARVA